MTKIISNDVHNPIRLYDVNGQRQQSLRLGHDISMYVCGITPYDAAHMGHIFTFITYDVLQRYLEYRGHTVRLVRNITDVDEPIYARAKTLGIPYTQLAETETEKFAAVMRQLRFREPLAQPKASDYIAPMAAAVGQLLKSGHAYHLDNGDIYFDSASFPAFGNASGLTHHLQLAFMADRGGDPQRADKRHPLDFLLWKAIDDPTDPAAWESPVGYGRPGWHIECSIMSSQLLATPIDIHGGGLDLLFPHHACEIAQSESLGQQPFVRRWMHVAPLYLHGEKMSKSLGNLVFAADLLQDYSADVIRLAMLQYHYRIGGEWHQDVLADAAELVGLIQRALLQDSGPDPTSYLTRFFNALDTDLNLPAARTALHDLAYDSQLQTAAVADPRPALRTMLHILGLEINQSAALPDLTKS